MFPHYSRHDESHSRQILVNIERLLGNNIEKLTATDTWLLLEAAYWHDIGMVVPRADVAKALQEQEFRDYLEEIRSNSIHELNRFATSFDIDDMTSCFAGADNPTDAVAKFGQLVSEWFRRKHPARAEAVVSSPWERAGIESPRTELIPKRLFRILARICHMHGLPFSTVIGAEGLPYREAGLAQEDCHPRFVACLLRLGDLLDVDDNRFCPVMQRIAGDNRPALSKAHEDKHQALRHLRLDQDRIELSAECKSIEGYVETFRWFDWIRKEIQDQMASWQDIVPERAFGMLPAVGKIAVRIEGETQILDEGNRPQFIIDSKQALSILQGTNLYSSEYKCMRELLQNAVDATLLRIWITQRSAPNHTGWNNPVADEAQKNLESHEIIVTIEEKEPSSAYAEKSIWRVEIKDQGTGISREDLRYMLRVGGSKRNTRRRAMIRGMPEWMKPSGIFGIGLQSVFMITEKIDIETKSIVSGEALRITMHSPGGPKDGLVLIKSAPNDPAQVAGTTMAFNFATDRFTKRWSRGLGEQHTAKNAFFEALDPLVHDKFPLAAAELADEVREFGAGSLIEVGTQLTTLKSTLGGGLTYNIAGRGANQADWKFRNVDGHIVGLQYSLIRAAYVPNQIVTYYRGQKFEAQLPSVPYVSIAINVMSGNAEQWLSASRDHVAAGAADEVAALTMKALAAQVEEDISSGIMRTTSKAFDPRAFSLFIEAMAIQEGGEWKDFAREIGPQWKKLSFFDDQMTLEEFLKGNGGIVWIDRFGRQTSAHESDGEHESSESEYALRVSDEPWLPDLLVRSWCEQKDATICILPPRDMSVDERSRFEALGDSGRMAMAQKQVLRCSFKREPQPAFTNAALTFALDRVPGGLGMNQRFLLPSSDRWAHLQLKSGVYSWIGPLFPFVAPNATLIVLPFLFRGEDRGVEASGRRFEDLCQWCCAHLERFTDISAIRSAYIEMIREIDVIMESSPYGESWQKRRKKGDAMHPD